MTLRVIGAGLNRTGTNSLKVALQTLLGGPCYHMSEVFRHQPHHPCFWQQACESGDADWHSFFNGYVATVDNPGALFWRQLTQAFPEAIVVLSVRDAESWYESHSETTAKIDQHPGTSDDMRSMFSALGKMRNRGNSKEEQILAFERHNAEVIAQVPSERLVVWRAEDGWAPLCKALDVPIPNTPFPKINSRKEFRRRLWRMHLKPSAILKALLGRTS